MSSLFIKLTCKRPRALLLMHTNNQSFNDISRIGLRLTTSQPSAIIGMTSQSSVGRDLGFYRSSQKCAPFFINSWWGQRPIYNSPHRLACSCALLISKPFRHHLRCRPILSAGSSSRIAKNYLDPTLIGGIAGILCFIACEPFTLGNRDQSWKQGTRTRALAF